MRDSLRHAVAEFIGTFALVFVGSGVLLLARATGQPISLLEIALAHGLILAVMVTATMRVSGHLNPAVTIGFLATRRIAPLMGLVYIVAQLLGAIIAAYVLKSVYPEADFMTARAGGTMVDTSITTGQAYLLEAIATFFLVFVVFGTAVDPRSPKVGGLAIGFTLAAGILAIGPLTGGSLNPARSFGPAVATGLWEGQFIYWLGPILGGVAAAALYEWLFLRRSVEPVDHGAVAPK
ncbi:MAG TPA: MIP/aquaporin family protein [Gemmatimonadaceae bacterium]|nr:MIP/aquaporin family protein [Gemmatimonadaceae bacterium]